MKICGINKRSKQQHNTTTTTTTLAHQYTVAFFDFLMTMLNHNLQLVCNIFHNKLQSSSAHKGPP